MKNIKFQLHAIEFCLMFQCRNLRLRRKILFFGIWQMATRNLTIGMIFVFQTTVGILGNFCLVYHFLFLYFTKCRFRSTDLILKHMTVPISWLFSPKESLKHQQLWGWNFFSMILDANLFSIFTEWAGMCPFVPLASWVSSKPSWSVPETLGGQSLR